LRKVVSGECAVVVYASVHHTKARPPIGLDDIKLVALPGPTIGAGLPGLIFASGGLLIWWLRTRRTQAVV
jgi:hypothetical protein